MEARTTIFSVIIPSYNRSEKILQAIRSVRRSCFDSYNIIVVDDGSTDDTCEKIGELKDSQVSYLRIENSKGPGRPRNVGIFESTGNWLCFLDSDDSFYPQKLERLNFYINNFPNVDLFYHKLKYSVQGFEVGEQFDFNSPDALYSLLSRNPVAMSGVCMSKDFVVARNLRFEESEQFVAVEDWDFWISSFLSGCRFKFVDEVLGEYNDVSADSIARNAQQVLKTRMVASKYFDRLTGFQRHCLKGYWDYQVTRSIFRQKALGFSESVPCLRRPIGVGADIVSRMRHPFSLIYRPTA